MKIVVLGSGIIGLTAAYELLRDGHDITVMDRAAGPALETSFANGGQISASHTDPWASPENLFRVLRWMGMRDSPLKLLPGGDPASLRWLWLFLKNCTQNRYRRNTERMLRLALYSRDRYDVLRSEISVVYDLEQRGILHVFRDPQAYEDSLRQARYVETLGCNRSPVSAEECLSIEPALATVGADLVGGVYCPEDESGDAYRFSTVLHEHCAKCGVTFRFNETVRGLKISGGRVTGVITDQGDDNADAVVVAMGSYSPLLLRTIGLRLPVLPAKGYSVTLPVPENKTAPHVSLIDDEHKLVYSRLGDRLRIAGMAELVGYDRAIEPQRVALLTRQACSLFPALQAAADRIRPDDVWTGLRPQTPDSVPVMGRAGALENLFVNTGHGTLGWTMAAGSARVTADLIGGTAPDISTDGLTLDRFG